MRTRLLSVRETVPAATGPVRLADRAPLLHGQGALHAGLAVPGHAAEERVAPGLQVHSRGRRPGRDEISPTELRARGVLDLDIVLERLLVVAVDRHGARLGADVLLIEG